MGKLTKKGGSVVKRNSSVAETGRKKTCKKLAKNERKSAGELAGKAGMRGDKNVRLCRNTEEVG